MTTTNIIDLSQERTTAADRRATGLLREVLGTAAEIVSSADVMSTAQRRDFIRQLVDMLVPAEVQARRRRGEKSINS